MRSPLAPLLGAVLAMAGCATNPVTKESDFVMLTESQEVELGRNYHEKILEQYAVHDDQALQDYVSRLGRRLARNSHRKDLDYTFTVLDSPEVNAFALPGGYVYITRGIMAYFNSEAALVGVLGHELGHVTARHSVQQYSANMASSILGSVLLAATDAGRAGANLFQTVQLAALQGYSREQELQADRLGAQYLARTGYDSDAMLDVIRILADQEDYERERARAAGREPNVYHGVFASHPENDRRLQEVIAEARQYEIADPRPDGRTEYLRMIEGMTFGAGASQGTVADHAFLHLELDAALEAPEGWAIDNRPQKVVFTAPDEAARLEATLGEAKAGASPRDLLAQRVSGNRLERARAFDARGWDGHTGVVQRQGRLIRHTVVLKDGQAWYFAATTREPGAFDRHDEAFLDIARSLHRLSEAERRAARPLRIRVIEAGTGTTYDELARSIDGVEDPVGRLRLLNGDWPEGQPEAGQLIKTLGR